MSNANRLRILLESPGLIQLPGVFDAMSVKLAERTGFKAAFISGFAVAATRLCVPDTGLISYSEMVEQARNICDSVSIPVIGDGDTGWGNPINVKRTVEGYANAGCACIMIEDQLAPKRCGHTRGKQIVERNEAFARIQAAVDAREEGADILVMARTDANATDGLDEAIDRCREFRRIGADITFLEAPLNKDEMFRYCGEVEGPKMANMVEQGDTPYLSPEDLSKIGYKIAVWPVASLLAGIKAMQAVLSNLYNGEVTEKDKITFSELRDLVGFPSYYEMEKKYSSAKPQ